MARDIEEFLKQAAQRRQKKLRERQQQQGGQQQGGQQRGQQPPQPARPPVVPRQPPRRKQPQRQPMRVEPEIQYIQPESTQGRQSKAGGRQVVESHIDTSSVTNHANHLGGRIESADERADQRIHDKFDHNIGDLKVGNLVSDDQSSIDQSDEIAPIAASLFEAFRNPSSIRQAILLNEILTRPNFD